jgi:hypothetical protein
MRTGNLSTSRLRTPRVAWWWRFGALLEGAAKQVGVLERDVEGQGI